MYQMIAINYEQQHKKQYILPPPPPPYVHVVDNFTPP